MIELFVARPFGSGPVGIGCAEKSFMLCQLTWSLFRPIGLNVNVWAVATTVPAYAMVAMLLPIVPLLTVGVMTDWRSGDTSRTRR